MSSCPVSEREGPQPERRAIPQNTLTSPRSNRMGPNISAATSPTVIERDPTRLRRCPPVCRLIEEIAEEEKFDALTNSVMVYGWDRHGRGLVESCRQTRRMIAIQFRGAWRAQPDALFDFLHTNFRNRWMLALLRSRTGRPYRLKTIFDNADAANEFQASWDRGICPLRATELDNLVQWPIGD